MHWGDGRGDFHTGNDMSWFGFEDISLAVCGECPIGRQDCRKRLQSSRQELLVAEKLETRPHETHPRGVSVSYNQIRIDHYSGLRPRSSLVASRVSPLGSEVSSKISPTFL